MTRNDKKGEDVQPLYGGPPRRYITTPRSCSNSWRSPYGARGNHAVEMRLQSLRGNMDRCVPTHAQRLGDLSEKLHLLPCALMLKRLSILDAASRLFASTDVNP